MRKLDGSLWSVAAGFLPAGLCLPQSAVCLGVRLELGGDYLSHSCEIRRLYFLSYFVNSE